MKINLLTTALVAILGLALAGAPVSVQAQTTPTPTTAKVKKDKGAKTTFMGSITAIDATSVTVASKKQTLTLAVGPKTVFKVDKAAGTAADFAVGDKVTGSYTTDASGAMTASLVHKKAAK